MEEITTKRLLLRRYVLRDRKEFITLLTDREVMKHVEGDVRDPREAEESWARVLKDEPAHAKRWCVCLRATGEFVGHSMTNRMEIDKSEYEIGYILPKHQWGKGYGTEIAKAVSSHCLEQMGLPRVFAGVDDDNYASIAVLRKSGFDFDRYEYDEKGRYSIFVRTA